MKVALLVAAAAAAVVGARGAEAEANVARNEPALEGAEEEELGRALLLRGGAGEAEADDEAGARELASLSGDTPPGTMSFVRNSDGSVTVTWALSGAKWMSVGLGTSMVGSSAVVGGKDAKPTSYRMTQQSSSGFVKDNTNPLAAATFTKAGTSTLTFKSKGIAKAKFSVNGNTDNIVWAYAGNAWPATHTAYGKGTLQLGVHCPSLKVAECASQISCKIKMKKCVPK